MNLPERFKQQMAELLSEEFPDFINSYEQKPNLGLRVNTLKISPEQFEKQTPFPVKKIPYIPNGYFYQEEIHPAKDPYYNAGLYYLQEPSAMIPASLLPVEKGDNVLDLCAAPGGKSTELAARLDGTGLLVANDISASRAKALLKNIELSGISNALLTSEAPAKLAGRFAGFFDKILVDAPCSGEGMFRKDPALIKSWEKNGPEFYAKLQREIVTEAARMLKPGGYLLYSTCTFSPLENEETISYLLDHDDSLEIAEIKDRYPEFGSGRPDWVENGRHELKHSVRIWPHQMNGEGHFAALIRKKDDPADFVPASQDRSAKPAAELEQFLSCISEDFNRLMVIDEKVYHIPMPQQQFKGLRVLRTGLFLGEQKKKRFEPSQALAMTLKKEQYDSAIDLDRNDQRVVKYLKGETIEASQAELSAGSADWKLICVDGFPLGWAKAAGGRLKNKYYAGWRRMY